MTMTQGVEGTWSREEYTTGTVKAAGDLVTTRGKRTREEETEDSELKKTKMAILGLRATTYIQLLAGFKAQLES